MYVIFKHFVGQNVCLSNVEVSVRFYKLVCLSVVTDIYFWLNKLTCFLIRDVSEWNRLVFFFS